MLLCMLIAVPLTACGSDDDDPSDPSSSIVGTWTYDESDNDITDVYTLVFNKDHTGYINNTWSSRTSQQMEFEWSLTQTSNGTYLLSVIYISGDRNMDGPFSGGYAQYNSTVTIAGNTLSISIDSSHVMLFRRK